ncbi:21700_t:CDS:2 [Cetraspora pellucida]|uniref:21700_t:CDS:1 n=1 Tax=Cetraspora pellucida TaxID=1433469 RepID=A0A9N8WLQ6_9GLOM|nr:21700_t:CDS:2 [Cetraspora pellucida]
MIKKLEIGHINSFIRTNEIFGSTGRLHKFSLARMIIYGTFNHKSVLRIFCTMNTMNKYLPQNDFIN